MICSMTAFAREEYRGDLGVLIWELRSVNHRYLEPHFRIPEELRAFEPLVRERLGKRLGRGKIDCALRFKPSADIEADVQVNQHLVKQLLKASNEIGTIMGSEANIRPMDLLRWPGIIQEQEKDLGPVQQQAMALLDQALDSLLDTRQREGERLGGMISDRCRQMRELVRQVRDLMPQILDGLRQRIRDRLQEVMEQLDESRLEQEMALIAQRLDVDEEMDRLDTHLAEVEAVLKRKEPIGRRLDFLMQELNRESNTLSSKSNSAELTRIAVDMKVLIEQMREQIQNIE